MSHSAFIELLTMAELWYGPLFEMRPVSTDTGIFSSFWNKKFYD
jgi:hypothetical protein